MHRVVKLRGGADSREEVVRAGRRVLSHRIRSSRRVVGRRAEGGRRKVECVFAVEGATGEAGPGLWGWVLPCERWPWAWRAAKRKPCRTPVSGFLPMRVTREWGAFRSRRVHDEQGRPEQACERDTNCGGRVSRSRAENRAGGTVGGFAALPITAAARRMQGFEWRGGMDKVLHESGTPYRSGITYLSDWRP